ncbi:MAG: hypothetical protein P8Y60_11350 [Calditrichota bacterium]
MKTFLLFPLFLTSALFAQLSPYQINGYAEYLASTSRYPEIDSRLYDQLFHFRLNTYWYPSNTLRGSMQLRMRAFYGNSVEKIPDFLDQIKTNYDFTNLDAVLWDAKNSLGYAQIDRLWLDYSLKNLELTLGRQRIAWGTALVWNVIDLYNPKSVLDFDYEEKPGTDALRLQYYTGPVSKLELVDKPGETFKETIIAGLYSVNAYNYDFYVIGGVRNDRWVAGGAWSLYSYDKTVVSFVLSADYTFSNSFYIHTESLFNGNGKTRNTGVFQNEALQIGMLSPARWSLYQEFSYDITPLTRGTLFGIFNPNDKSYIIVPMLTHSLATNWDLLLIGLLAQGDPLTEYGDYGTSVYVRLKYSF